MGGNSSRRQAELQTEELRRQNELLKRKIENQEKLLKIVILNTKVLVASLSNSVDDKNIITNLNKLLDQQEQILNENLSEETSFLSRNPFWIFW